MKLRIEFKPQDCWVGAFWQRKGNIQHLWICLLPMLPLHFEWAVAAKEYEAVNEIARSAYQSMKDD